MTDSKVHRIWFSFSPAHVDLSNCWHNSLYQLTYLRIEIYSKFVGQPWKFTASLLHVHFSTNNAIPEYFNTGWWQSKQLVWGTDRKRGKRTAISCHHLPIFATLSSSSSHSNTGIWTRQTPYFHSHPLHLLVLSYSNSSENTDKLSPWKVNC